MPADTHDHTVVVHVTPGELLDQRWRIETRIGQGAMGSVFKGRDVQANKLVAIKILAPEHCRKPKVVARFEREAEKMTGLRHQNIVAFQGHGRRGALPFIVMEFLEGLTLSDIIEKHGGKVGLAETVAIVKQIASGLAFLHHNGLVHRDIKPQNVFFCVGGRVTILDLGVVRDQANPGLTRPGAMVGTPYYMSPEQILGVEDIDKRTDVYALAAVTFELLTGRPPYLGNNNFEVLYGHKNTPPPDASALVKGLSKTVSQVIIRGLAKRRDERPETVTEFVADLEAAAGAKKVDLARAFNLPTTQATDQKVAVQKTRLVPKKLAEDAKELGRKAVPPLATEQQPALTPQDSDPSGESPSSEAPIPEASNSDVVSVPGLPLSDTGSSGEQKTVVFRFDEERPKIRARVPTQQQLPQPAPDPPSGERTVVGLPTSAASGAPKIRASSVNVPQQPPPSAPEDPTGDNPAPVAANTGQLRVVVTAKGIAAEANLLVDGQPRGQSPNTLTLTAGPHQIRITLDGYRTVERWATVIPGTSTNLRVFMEKV
ncbi:MAG: protein kinase [Archangium sp.]|nr:protein kinase [Archangium sp.]